MVRSYPIDEDVVRRAVEVSGDRPVEQVIREALEQYAVNRQEPQPDSDFQAKARQWLAEGGAFSSGGGMGKDEFGELLVEKHRKQGLVI